MIPTGTIEIRKYLFILRRRWVPSAAVFLMVLAAGLAYCLFWTPVYEAVALVVVHPQRVPTQIVQSTVTTKMQDRLQIITQNVLSRTRLMEIIERFDLYPEARGKAAPDALAERMRNDVSIKISSQNYFTVSFIYTQPQAAAAVANALAAFYVDSNLRLREDDATGTANFLARELEQMRNKLREWDKRITEFKEAHMHELPGSEEKNLSMLKFLSNQRDMVEYRIFQAGVRIDGLENDISRLTMDIQQLEFKKADMLKEGVAVGGGGEAVEAADDPEALRRRLEGLLVKYTEEHPEVVEARRLLKLAEAKKAREELEAKERGEAPQDDENLQAKSVELELGSLQEQIERKAQTKAELRERIEQLKREAAQVGRSIAEVRQRIENMPATEEKLDALTRGYSVLKRSYERMHTRWLEANTAANLERTQRGEQFEVVDPAEVPTSPFRPDVRKALPMALALALALGVGLAFGLSYIDTSFTSVEQAEALAELPVLGVLPPLYTDQEIESRQRKLSILIALYGSLGLFLLGLTAILFTGRGPALKSLVGKIFG
jgi:polysaccharide chain length determinant protein (PEP-CTERM system associated)